MDRANALVHETLRLVAEAAKPGVSTTELDGSPRSTSAPRGGKPAFKGYRGYPATLCTSVNDVIVHGIPSALAQLREGDILWVDCGVVLDGFYGDAAITVAIGEVSAGGRAPHARSRGSASSWRWMSSGPGSGSTDIGRDDPERTPRARGSRWCGSSSGTASAAPCTRTRRCPTSGPADGGRSCRPGLVLAIEPMINAGDGGRRLRRRRLDSAHRRR